MDWITELASSLATSYWVLPVLYTACVIDGIFPPIPSEGMVVLLAALSASGHAVGLGWIFITAVLGAFSGDLVAYFLGRAIPVHTMPGLRGPRGKLLISKAEKTLNRRGTAYLLAARFIPVGRVAVNMIAGATRFPWPRFISTVMVGAFLWSIYQISLALVAGYFLDRHPLIAAAVGVLTGILLAFVIDFLMDKVAKRWTKQHLVPQALEPESVGQPESVNQDDSI